MWSQMSNPWCVSPVSSCMVGMRSCWPRADCMQTCGWSSSRLRILTPLLTQKPRTGSQKNYSPHQPLGATPMATEHNTASQGIWFGYRETAHEVQAETESVQLQITDRAWVFILLVLRPFGAQFDKNMLILNSLFFFNHNFYLLFELLASDCAWDFEGVTVPLHILQLHLFFWSRTQNICIFCFSTACRLSAPCPCSVNI